MRDTSSEVVSLCIITEYSSGFAWHGLVYVIVFVFVWFIIIVAVIVVIAGCVDIVVAVVIQISIVARVAIRFIVVTAG